MDHDVQKVLLIREEALRRLIPVSHSTLFRWERDGKFPPRIKIGAKAVAWRVADIEEWIATKSGEAATGEHVAIPAAIRGAAQ